MDVRCQLRVLAALLPGKSPRYLLNKKLVLFNSLSASCREQKETPSCWESNALFLVVNIATKLFQLPQTRKYFSKP